MRHTLVLAALLALATARANEWCGFVDKEHSPVRCGYSSLAKCQQSLLDNKDAYCMPDPGFASVWRPERFAATERRRPAD